MSEMPDVLKKIVDYKTGELAGVKSAAPLNEVMAQLGNLEDHPRGFEAAILNACFGLDGDHRRGEKRLPLKGVIRPDFDPLEIAQIYQDNGATCLSVLTDEHFFLGHLSYLALIREQVSLPLLRKDFIFDPYQIYQARARGSRRHSADRRHAGAFPAARLSSPWRANCPWTCFSRCTTRRELETALADRLPPDRHQQPRPAQLRGRHLHLGAAGRPDTGRRIIVAESGITRREEIVRLTEKGLHAFLIGESLMRENDIGAKLRELLG